MTNDEQTLCWMTNATAVGGACPVHKGAACLEQFPVPATPPESPDVGTGGRETGCECASCRAVRSYAFAASCCPDGLTHGAMCTHGTGFAPVSPRDLRERARASLRDDAELGRLLRAALESVPDGFIELRGARYESSNPDRTAAYVYGSAFRNTEIRALARALAHRGTP